MRKVLYVCHTHSSVRPGGLELYADELYRGMRDAGQFEPILVAKAGTPHTTDTPNPGTRFALVGEDPNVYLLYTEAQEFDRLFGTSRRKRLYTEDWREFLRVHKPDVVHFQHANWLGYDMLRETRRTLPEAAILYTLHEFVPICYHLGQMVRVDSMELCSEASPRRCNQCFPQVSRERFFLRERFIKAAFEHVDMFISPSEQLRQRFIEWGLSPERIRFEENGRLPVERVPEHPDAGRRRRIGFFGQITRFKGVDVLLEAMKILQREESDIHLLIHGSNLENQRASFREQIQALLEETADVVKLVGRYEPYEVPALMSAIDWVIVPSVWWENAPMVIQEAMANGRPVICSDIGGMAEKVRNGVDGLHFRRADPYSLADTIREATGSPELWDRLHANIRDPHPIDAHVATLHSWYEEMISRHQAPTAAVA